MGRLRVQHCVVNVTTRQYGPIPTSDILGVDYFHTVPADTEFPRTLGKLELFVRFFGTDGVSGSVRVTVSHLNVLVPGEGTYAVRVTRRVRRPWEAKPGWRVLAADYLHIARAT